MIRKSLCILALLLVSACEKPQPGGINGPPLPNPGLPTFSNAPTIYGTPDDPSKFGPARSRIEGNTFYIVADADADTVADTFDKSLFSRRIKYDPVARTLRSDHRELSLKYDESKGAFVGQIVHPQTRRPRYVEVTVLESELPQ